ncbi:unnamed protein product [Peniophora sp. CBMAI 1063]|nr:unnamed protein product [Peniophora sp. CBMAI 1063]
MPRLRSIGILAGLAGGVFLLVLLAELYAIESQRWKHREPSLPSSRDFSLGDDFRPHPLDLAVGADPVDPAYPAPALTLIVLWYPPAIPDTRTELLPNFLASAAANPSVDVLILKFDKDNVGSACDPLATAVEAPNVREVCLEMEEYYTLHVDYLCGQWRCDDAQRRRTRQLVEQRTRSDRVNSLYRPFRAEIFKKYLHPDLKLWGWADTDLFLGSFERMFPWDVAHDFDVLFSAWPSNMDDIHVFVPGHLAIFRRDAAVAAEFMKVDWLSSFSSFENMPFTPTEATEEAEFSHLLFMRTGLSFLRFDALADSQYHVSTLGGVFALEDPTAAMLALDDYDAVAHIPIPGRAYNESAPPTAGEVLLASRAHITTVVRQRLRDAHRRSTFSPEGREVAVDLLNDKHADHGLVYWFPADFAVYYHSSLGRDMLMHGRDTRRFLMRRQRGGPVTERFEPEVRLAFGSHSTRPRPWLREAIYTHFQREKSAEWWSMPMRAIAPGEMLYVDREASAHLWDARAHIVWENSKVSVAH